MESVILAWLDDVYLFILFQKYQFSLNSFGFSDYWRVITLPFYVFVVDEMLFKTSWFFEKESSHSVIFTASEVKD